MFVHIINYFCTKHFRFMTDQIFVKIQNAFKTLFDSDIAKDNINLEKTRKEFEGDLTFNVFPFLKLSRKSPEETANLIGNYLLENVSIIEKFNVIKGFLNLSLSEKFWLESLSQDNKVNQTGKEKIVLEFSSPNTNKPLHLGHIRNNLLGESLSRILDAVGNKVIKVNQVNDRGIHICKSMLAWQRWGNGETPESSHKKGDKLVGDYYVLFDKKYKEEIESFVAKGLSEDEAKNQSKLMEEAREMLIKWEQGDEEVLSLWKKMNEWVYAGFDETYQKLGISFDKIYHESETYKTGKSVVKTGLAKKIFFQKEDGSVWIDLTNDGLDEKLLLRSDGTSVYITQDIGTYLLRNTDWNADKYTYVVGNEQEYHFKVLKLILQKLGFKDNVLHVSYGMVNLPHGKMKSREGTVVDADDLIDEMYQQAELKAGELGKLDELSDSEKQHIYKIVGMGALKYFILKVDAKKDMLFDPEQSVDFEGNTAPFIQYTYARIQSLKRKAVTMDVDVILKPITDYQLNDSEKELIKMISSADEAVQLAAKRLNPSVVANYTYDLAKEFNKFYQDNPILKSTNSKDTMHFRLTLSDRVGKVIQMTLNLLGIDVPERM